MVGLLLLLSMSLSWLWQVYRPRGRIRLLVSVFAACRVGVRGKGGVIAVPEFAVREGLAGGISCSPSLGLPHGRFLGSRA